MIKQNRIYVCIYETNRTNKTQNDIKQKMKKMDILFGGIFYNWRKNTCIWRINGKKEKIYYQSVIIHHGDTL